MFAFNSKLYTNCQMVPPILSLLQILILSAFLILSIFIWLYVALFPEKPNCAMHYSMSFPFPLTDKSWSSFYNSKQIHTWTILFSNWMALHNWMHQKLFCYCFRDVNLDCCYFNSYKKPYNELFFHWSCWI
jgi:hypothetical protein